MRVAAPSIALAASLFASSAAAIVTQPDGVVIPQTDHVQTLFDSRSDPVNARDDAAIIPETFHPGCSLTFTLVSRGGATFRDAFGWYNVTGSAPAASDLHVLIPCGSTAGFVAPLNLSTEPDYRGGEIGFFLRTPEQSGACAGGDCCATLTHPGYTYYSERRFNPDNTGVATSFIHLLVYNSHATTRAFYFAWEDLYGGGDNEFTDFVAQVGNIVCSGGGAACDTGLPGICGQGTQQCRAGALQCIGTNSPRAETCNGLDDDCNGMTDEGAGLCGAVQICDRGVCVDRCVEDSCFAGFTCSTEGSCVASNCIGVTCGAGQRCEAGACVSPCDGVTCPNGLSCREGRCVDACAGVTCDPEQVCTAGVCQPRCQCGGCGAGLACASDGRCVEAACASTSCGSGQVCAGGTCVDPCSIAVCPRGQVCVDRACVDAPVTADGGVGDASVDAGGDAMTALDVATTDAASDATGATDARVDASFGHPRSGCSCRVPAGNLPHHRDACAAAVIAMAIARRRRRSRGAPR